MCGRRPGLARWLFVPDESLVSSTEAPNPTPARVVLLAGPSGAGKTYVARAAGLPVLALDDFYRAGTEPDMPRDRTGAIDWEDPASWDGDAAVTALGALCRADEVEVPTYVFNENRAVGTHVIGRDGAPIILAEGIFAADAIAPLTKAGLLADALLIIEPRWRTFVRRLVRDLREGRKGRLRLLRTGLAKTRSEPAVVARQRALGARPMTKPEARSRIADLAAGWRPGAPPTPATVASAGGSAGESTHT